MLLLLYSLLLFLLELLALHNSFLRVKAALFSSLNWKILDETWTV